MAFAEDDVKDLKGFMEFIRDKATFALSLEESLRLTKYTQFLQSHIKKVYDHVGELRHITEPAPAPAPAKKQSAKG